MELVPWMDQIPLVGVFVAAMVIVLGSIGGGYFAGNWQSKRRKSGGDGVIGSAVGAMLGLLAFILAFTFGSTASRFDTRRQLLLDEVNAIGTANLRAGLLPQPERARCEQLLRSYVDLRANPDHSIDAVQKRIEESEQILDQLWAETTSLVATDMDPPLRALFVQAINETIDLHTARVTVGLHYRIPDTVWLCLFGATFCAMFAVGYQFGIAQQLKVMIHVLLAALFSTIVLLIADLDRSTEGSVTVDLQPMQYLQEQLNAPRPGVAPGN